jgi:VanZ family protein
MFESLFQKYPFFRAVPCILCMAIIFKLSSLTDMDLKEFPQIWDKLAHFLEYATLAGCYAMIWTRNEWSRRQWLRVLIVGFLALAYGCTDEYHQSFVEGRDCSALDLVADLTGGLFGGVVYAVITRILNRFDPVTPQNPHA